MLFGWVFDGEKDTFGNNEKEKGKLREGEIVIIAVYGNFANVTCL